jgi:hypothetical protein
VSADRLFLRHNGGPIVTVEGDTQIGRGRGERRDRGAWYTERPPPADFAELELVIDIDGSPYMSRNHVAIRRAADGFTVQDLNSANGTYRNGERLEAGSRYPLAAGDRLALGVDLFEVAEAPDGFVSEQAPEEAVLRRGVLRSEWYLGVAGFDERDYARRAFHASVARIARAMHDRGYATEVHGIDPTDAPGQGSSVTQVVRLSELLESLARRACAADSRAHTFFQYSGHGVKDGLVVSSGELLTPATLYDVCASIRGRKLLFLDACHAGVFLADKERIPPRTVVLAATRTRDDVAYYDGPATAAQRTDLPMTKLSRRLWDMLRDRLDTFDILSERAALEAAFQAQSDGAIHEQAPGMNTASYTVCLRSVSMRAIGRDDVERIIAERRGRGE